MKTIVILSTEAWGKMMLSKMHYAKELASKGHKVYFVNPPIAGNRETASISHLFNLHNITVINLKPLWAASFFRHKMPFVFTWLSNKYINAIKKLIPGKVDEVWCFNPHIFAGLKKFDADKNLLFLYDFYKGKYVFNIAREADAIITISKVILDHYNTVAIPKLLLQHGLSQNFSEIADANLTTLQTDAEGKEKIKVGYVGNLLREGMDIAIAKQIIDEHPEKEFHFWGPYTFENNNVTGKSIFIAKDLLVFIEYLKSKQNIFLHGVKEEKELAREINTVDCFLFIYSSDKDLNKASNSHKILEYLSTGKSIISTFVSNYQHTDLLTMCKPGDNSDLPALFTSTTNDLCTSNSVARQRKRILFALNNSYAKQVERIDDFIYSRTTK